VEGFFSLRIEIGCEGVEGFFSLRIEIGWGCGRILLAEDRIHWIRWRNFGCHKMLRIS
jgi:hypothetical protein